MGTIFFEITVLICLASVLSILFRLLRQPPILAYILAGILVGPFGQFQFQNYEVFRAMSEFGIMLVLFLVGLEMRLSELKTIGKTALIVGVAQVVFTGAIGYAVCLALGFSQIASAYIAIALTFSSTIIIVKLLSDKRNLGSLFGKISVGMLLVQDVIAVFILIGLSGLSSSGVSVSHFGGAFVKAVILFTIVIAISKTVLPKLIDSIARSEEVLFLFSVAWVFAIAALVSAPFIGFSPAIGGLLAGLALANSTENFHIVSKVRPLRDFFIIIFFVILGMDTIFANIGLIWLPALILSVFILVGNPLIVMVIMGVMGYRRKTAFFTGLTMAQISEFSLILVFVGMQLNHIEAYVVSLVTLVGIITFTVSTYLILYNQFLYERLSQFLKVFERANPFEEKHTKPVFQNHVVLVGVNRMGRGILNELLKKGKEVVAVDLNPDIVKSFQEKNVPIIFGDIADSDIQEHAGVVSAKLIISTVQEIEDNKMLIQRLKRLNRNAKIIVVGRDPVEAKLLYKTGADYVVIPHLAGGRIVSHLLKEKELSSALQTFREKDLKFLKSNFE